MLLSVNLDDLHAMQDFCIKKAIKIAKMIDSQKPQIQFLLNGQSLMFAIKDKPSGSRTLGKYYYPSSRADLYIDEGISHNLIMCALVHEFAHHLQYKSKFKSDDWTKDLNHPSQDALYIKYKELCGTYYAASSAKEMAAEAFRILMGWVRPIDWELDQSFRNDWFDFFYSQKMFSNCLGASIDEAVSRRYYNKMIEEMGV
jgi:hypothetical protein